MPRCRPRRVLPVDGVCIIWRRGSKSTDHAVTPGGRPMTPVAFAPPMSSDALAQLERLRLFRGRRERDTSIASLINSIDRDLKRQDRAVGGADDAWQRLVPAELLQATRVISFARGVLVVAANSSACAFELDRALRGGLEGELRAALRAGSLRVRVRVGA